MCQVKICRQTFFGEKTPISHIRVATEYKISYRNTSTGELGCPTKQNRTVITPDKKSPNLAVGEYDPSVPSRHFRQTKVAAKLCA